MNVDIMSIIETAGRKHGSNEVLYQRLLEQNHQEGGIDNKKYGVKLVFEQPKTYVKDA